jgi:hypothetical protein
LAVARTLPLHAVMLETGEQQGWCWWAGGGGGDGVAGCCFVGIGAHQAAQYPPPHTPTAPGADAPWCEIKRTHASHALSLPPAPAAPGGTALGIVEPPAGVKKERWAPGATVAGRCEPCHIVQVARVVAAMLTGGDVPALAAAAQANTMAMFWPREAGTAPGLGSSAP